MAFVFLGNRSIVMSGRRGAAADLFDANASSLRHRSVWLSRRSSEESVVTHEKSIGLMDPMPMISRKSDRRGQSKALFHDGFHVFTDFTNEKREAEMTKNAEVLDVYDSTWVGK